MSVVQKIINGNIINAFITKSDVTFLCESDYFTEKEAMEIQAEFGYPADVFGFHHFEVTPSDELSSFFTNKFYTHTWKCCLK